MRYQMKTSFSKGIDRYVVLYLILIVLLIVVILELFYDEPKTVCGVREPAQSQAEAAPCDMQQKRVPAPNQPGTHSEGG
jgi:hypothetical protein